MKEAFESIGYEVTFITGGASRRKELIRGLKQRMEAGEKFDFLYSESSTLPMFLTERHHLPTHPFTDNGLFALAKKHGVPIGLFYRDIYWAFREVHRFGWLKSLYTYLFHILELIIYNRYLDVFYFPGDDRDKVFGKLKVLSKKIGFHPLYAGADVHPSRPDGSGEYFVYIGGNRPDLHDLKVVLQAFGNVPGQNLKICTPYESWRANEDYYRSYLRPNIEILHLTDQDAQDLLSKARYALNYFPDSEYRQYTAPYKLFEYAGHDLPVIWNRTDLSGKIVSGLGIGYAIRYSVEDLTTWLKDPPSDDEYQRIRAHIAVVKKDHTWTKRAETVRDTLCRNGKRA
jgi:hypothetical protein